MSWWIGFSALIADTLHRAIEQLGGLELEQDYPYTAEGQKCTIDKTKIHVRVTGAVDLPANETAMAQWLTVNGPLSIGEWLRFTSFHLWSAV